MNETITVPEGYRGQMGVTTIDGKMWIDLFPTVKDEYTATWRNGKWEKRNLWEVDDGWAFTLRGFHYHKWAWAWLLNYARTRNNRRARCIREFNKWRAHA